MSKRLIFSLAAAALIGSPVIAQDTPTADTIVATVNGTDIKLGHMVMVRQQLPQQYQQLPPNVLFDGILEQLIQQTVLSQSAGDDLPARVTLSIENQERALVAGDVVEKVGEAAATENAIQAEYEERYLNVEPAQEYNASHILVPTLEEAQAVKAELDAGAAFAETAMEKSTGPSGPNGGALGWFGAGMMVPPFEVAVMELTIGQISEPVETQFGWHVIILNDTRQEEAPTLDEVRAELVALLQREAVEARIAELTAAAVITQIEQGAIDPELLTDPDLVFE
jgi:peptidyl-prolyl cis-trans isomerase C